MLPSEQLRNKNQRLIPLTVELIQDMLRNEGLEYQTPPGARLYTSEDDSFASTSLAHCTKKWKAESLHLNLNSKQHEPHTSSSIDLRYNSESDSGEDSEQVNLMASDSLDTLYSDSLVEQASSSADTDSSDLQSLVDLLCSVQRLNNEKDAESRVRNTIQLDDTSNAIDKEWPIPSRRRLSYAISDSSIRKPPEQIEKKNEYTTNHQFRANHHWINVLVVNKSETSFLLNQYKLQNFKTNSCNAYYKTEPKDLKRDQEAVASLLAAPSCERNSRNAYW